jgi:hypothetical protein
MQPGDNKSSAWCGVSSMHNYADMTTTMILITRLAAVLGCRADSEPSWTSRDSGGGGNSGGKQG